MNIEKNLLQIIGIKNTIILDNIKKGKNKMNDLEIIKFRQSIIFFFLLFSNLTILFIICEILKKLL